VGEETYVGPEQIVPYTIRFENMSTATAPAQQVIVSDRLDDDLDLSTVQLTAIAFNDVILEPPPGLDHYEGLTQVGSDPNPVQVHAALDVETGIITWTIESVDSVTGGLPDDPLAGFLPPNDDQRRGEGLVAFTVRPRAGLAGGTQITNQAEILFDVNDPILTNVVTSTIDADPPSSIVSALPAESPSPLTHRDPGQLHRHGGLHVWLLHRGDRQRGPPAVGTGRSPSHRNDRGHHLPAGGAEGLRSAAGALRATLSAPTHATVSPSGSTRVALAVDDDANLVGGDIVLNYDPSAVTASNARATSLSANLNVEFNVPGGEPGPHLAQAHTGSEGGLASGSGTLVEIRFTGSVSAAADSTSTLNLASVRLNDQYGRHFATSAVQTAINVTHGLLTLEGAANYVYLPVIVR
jgi:uncharacterized repeat protein (TIGR01451 family)